jgi:hypothetical protein
MKTLLTLCALCVSAFPLSAAELERLAPSALKLRVTPNPDPRPSVRRFLTVGLYNGSFDADSYTVRTIWITGEPAVSRTESVTYTLVSHQEGEDLNMDSGPLSPGAKLAGWVITVRRGDGALVAVKGSNTRYEQLARTPGALPAKPGPIVTK